ELLKLRGNVNDRVRRHDAKYHIEKGTSLPLGKEGKSAMELAKEVAAPQAILEGLSGRAEACCHLDCTT
ncbi:unnamed protein product, partial [Durusdinium trenchii]